MWRRIRNRFTRKKPRSANIIPEEKRPLLSQSHVNETNMRTLRNRSVKERLKDFDNIQRMQVDLIKKVITDELEEQRRECVETDEFIKQLDKLNPYESAVDAFKLENSMRELFKRRSDQGIAAEERSISVLNAFRKAMLKIYGRHNKYE